MTALNDSESWNEFAAYTSPETFLKNLLRVDINCVYHSTKLLAYRIDLRKSLNLQYKWCLFFIFRPSKNAAPKDMDEFVIETRNTIKSEKLGDQPHIVFFWDDNKVKMEYLEGALDDMVVADYEELESLLHNLNPKDHIFRLLKLQKIKTATCPFKYLGACNSEMFVGRSDVITDILNSETNGFAITGGRRIGKSSLLFKLQDEVERKSGNPYYTLYMDCSNFNGFKILIERIGQRLSQEFGRIGSDFEEMLTNLKRRGKKLLLLLDEMDPLIERYKLDSVYAKQFFNTIRSQTNQNFLKVVIAGYRKVANMIRDREYPFYNVCEGITLPVLTQKEVNTLVGIPFFKIGITLEDQDSIINKIYDHTAGHPSMVQFIAKELFKIKNGDCVNMSDLNKVIHNQRVIRFMRDDFAENTSPLERLICVLVHSKQSFDKEMILRNIKEENIETPFLNQKVDEAIESLVINNIFGEQDVKLKPGGEQNSEQGSEYHFLYPWMSAIINNYFGQSSDKKFLKKEIKDECSR